jgi:hypothetical protein
VSHAHPDQLDDVIDLVGEREILVLDNGAFTHWRQGRGAIDRGAFWAWANAAQGRCSNAVAVIPDVIEGGERENLLEMSWALRNGLAAHPSRTMGIWHMDESLDFLRTQCRLLNFVGVGSCARYDVQRKRPEYLARIREASQVIDEIEAEHNRRPWIHLMRGLGVYADVTRFDSADSTNVAVNHHRYAAAFGNQRARYLKLRTQAKILAGVTAADIEIITSSIGNFENPPTKRPHLTPEV